jgi:ribosomal protein S18 acetylase RimI-like enzyme
VIAYRRSRNTDPPALVEVWNETVTGRGSYPVRTPALLERWIFSRTYFTQDDLTVAYDDQTGAVAGFSLIGFGPTDDLTALAPDRGVVCAVLVRPAFRRQGVGREFLRRADADLRARGATSVAVGSLWPNNPYLFGLYGGSNSPGILSGEPDADPFLRSQGYAPAESALVFQRKLDTPLAVVDTRFALLRRRYEVQVLRAASIGSWWQDCQWGMLEPVELRAVDKLTGLPAARAVVWELEGFSWKWNYPSAGILDVQVRPDLRKQGLGKMLVSQVLRFLQDQFFAVAELQVPAHDEPAVGLCKSLGFDQIDVGFAYRKPEATA